MGGSGCRARGGDGPCPPRNQLPGLTRKMVFDAARGMCSSFVQNGNRALRHPWALGTPGHHHREAVPGGRRPRPEGRVGRAAHCPGHDAASPDVRPVRVVGCGGPGRPACPGADLAPSGALCAGSSAAPSAARVRLADPACAGGCRLWQSVAVLDGGPGAGGVAGKGAASGAHPALAVPDARDPAGARAASGTACASNTLGRPPRRIRPPRTRGRVDAGCAVLLAWAAA
jgi:hypothetical protein